MTTGSLALADADIPTLTAIYLEELAAVAAVAAMLNDEQWAMASPCPGWSAGDVVAHIAALESELHGEPLPAHEPDWESLPHAFDTQLGQYTELPVDWRRQYSRSQVVDELAELAVARRSDFDPVPTDPDEQVLSFAGIPMPRRQLLGMRILDCWSHEQDIRAAAGLPGGLDSRAGWVTAGKFVSGLPYVWGKKTGAPPGASVVLEVTGPGVQFSAAAVVGDNGRAVLTDDLPMAPTVRIRLDWPSYLALSAGRGGAVSAALAGGAQITGDTGLGERFINSMTVTP